MTLTAEDLKFAYRISCLKREKKDVLILSATLQAERSSREAAWKTLMEMSEKRQATQPTGASTGSTFKNQPGDYAGRLIEAAGLKGLQDGHARFSGLHANFIVMTAFQRAGIPEADPPAQKTSWKNSLALNLKLN